MRQVWQGLDLEVMGAPSPDGRYICYTDWETDDVAIYEISNGKKRRLTDNATGEGGWIEESRWSPDGKQIVYTWWRRDGTGDLRIVGLDGSKPRILFHDEKVPGVSAADWSPDGKYILASMSKQRDYFISLVSVADGSTRIVKNVRASNMHFSPDGRYIAYDYYAYEGSPNKDIHLLSIDGKQEIPLVEHPANDFLLGWAPDGGYILFASDRTGSFDAWIIPVADGKPKGIPEVIRKNIGLIWPMGFTRDGSFFYGFSKGMKSVYIATIDPETQKSTAPAKKLELPYEGRNHSAEYSPDGKKLAFTRSSLPAPEANELRARNYLCIRSLRSGEERVFPLNIHVHSLRWAPDSSLVMVSGLDKERRSGIYMVDTQDGNIEEMLQSKRDVRKESFHTPDWSSDGKAVFYTHRTTDDNLCRIMLQELDSGRTEEIYRLDCNKRPLFSLSPDGLWLGLIEQPFNNSPEVEKRVIKIIPAKGGKPRELCRFENRSNHMVRPRWSADGRFVLFARNVGGDQKDDLWCVPIEGGKPQKLGTPMYRISDISPHPDGRQIIFTSHGPTLIAPEIWVMENFLPEQKAKKKSK